MLFSLKGYRALVTGGSGSIGRSIAMGLARQGAQVVICGTRDIVLHEVAQNIESETGIVPGTITCNLSDSFEVSGLVDKACELLGDNIDILVNNAGINKDMLFMKMKESDLEEVMKVNVNAVFTLMRNAIQVMSGNGHGRIINISSVVGFTGNIGQVNYCASKAAIVGMSKAVALEVARKGITVNCVAPGAIESPMLEKLSDANKEKFMAKIPMQQIGKPDDVANVCCFLASKEAAYITGQTIHVNGGMLMQ